MEGEGGGGGGGEHRNAEKRGKTITWSRYVQQSPNHGKLPSTGI